MKLIKNILLVFVSSIITATICFRVCKKRVNITDFKHWKVVDDNWERLFDL